MIISMAVILVPVLLLVLFYARPGDQKVEEVSVAETFEVARAQSPYALLQAEGLGEGWSPVRVAWALDGNPWITNEPAEGDSWQVGYMSPDGVYHGVQQRNDNEARFIDATTREGRAVGGQVEFAGRTWDRYESEDGRTRSLVSEGDDDVAIVTADADFIELEAFAASLVEVAPGSE